MSTRACAVLQLVPGRAWLRCLVEQGIALAHWRDSVPKGHPDQGHCAETSQKSAGFPVLFMTFMTFQERACIPRHRALNLKGRVVGGSTHHPIKKGLFQPPGPRSQPVRSQIPGLRPQVPARQVPGPSPQVPGLSPSGHRSQVSGLRSQPVRFQVPAIRSQVSVRQVTGSRSHWIQNIIFDSSPLVLS